MIKSWRHKGLKKFYETGSKAGIQAKHANTLKLLLFQLANAVSAQDMNTPGNDFHALSGILKKFYSIKISANWRLIFQFVNKHATQVDYLDYH